MADNALSYMSEDKAQSPEEETSEPGVEQPDEDERGLKKDIEKHFSDQVEAADRKRKDRHYKWKRNIELRQGNPDGRYNSNAMDNVDDDYQSEVNPDWYLSKDKSSALFSQTPRVILTHKHEPYKPAVGPLTKAVNEEISETRCNTGAAMFEATNDIVNAAGIAAIEIGYAARFVKKSVPRPDMLLLPPEMKAQLMASGQMPMIEVEFPSDIRFFTDRFSIDDLLIPVAFLGSDFNKGPWMGRRFKTSKAEATLNYKIKDETIWEQISESEAKSEDNLKTDRDNDTKVTQDLKEIRGKKVFYKRYRVDPDCKFFDEIWEIVWLDGVEKPVRHEKWKGQQFVPDVGQDGKPQVTGKYVGSCKFPIQAGTTTYISDNPVPPSDSQAARPQVNDLRRSRSQIFQNRAFSFPFRWFNTNLTDPTTYDLLMRGRVQGMFPVQGDGSKAFGEMARSSYPQENMAFDRTTMDDMFRSWGIGPNQMGQLASHETTAGEAQMAQQGYNNVMSQERGRVAQLFLNTVEVLTGLMALYSDFSSLTQQEREVMKKSWDGKKVLFGLAFSILPDSQIATSTDSQIKRLTQLLNIGGKSGFLNVKALFTKLVELHGEDPNEMIVDPQPHPMKPMSMSLGLKGREDLLNPVVAAIAMKNGQWPTDEEIEKARQTIIKLNMGMPLGQPQMPPGGGPQRPGMPPQPGAPKPPMPARPPVSQDQAPQWSLMNRVAKRTGDI